MGQLLWGLAKAIWCLMALGAMLAVMGFQASLIVLWWIVGALAGLVALVCERYRLYLMELEKARQLQQEMELINQSLTLTKRLHQITVSGVNDSGDWQGASPLASQESLVRGDQLTASQRSVTTAPQQPIRSSLDQTDTKSQGQTRRPL